MQVPRILWFALLMSTVIFLGVLLFQKQSGVLPTSPTSPIMLPALGAVALVVAAMSLFLPRQMQRQALLNADLKVTTEADPDAVGMFRDAAPGLRVFANEAKVVRVGIQAYQSPLIIGLALSEAVALFGFVLGMLGFELLHILPFWVASWALIAVRFPTEARVIDPIEKAYDAKLR